MQEKTLYLSHWLNASTPTYGNRTKVELTPASCICHGDSSNSLHLSFSNHVGTHMDLPRHFDDRGKTLSDYGPDEWEFEKVKLIDLPCPEKKIIEVEDLRPFDFDDAEVLLIRTGFEQRRKEDVYWSSNPGIGAEVGHWLRDHFPKLRILGFDFISVTSYADRPLGRIAHRSLLAEHNGTEAIRVIEDMKLAGLVGSPASLLVSPLLIEAADGIQVTVVAKMG